jgi:hypothetical protein
MNAPESSSVSCSHVLVQGLNSGGAGKVTVLFVHIVGAGAGVVSNPDTKVLDFGRAFLGNDLHADNLTCGLLDLSELLHEVPVSGFGDNAVGCKDLETVELGSRISLGWQVAANDLVTRSDSGIGDIY